MNGISFASHPADKAVHHPGSRVARLKLLQQTSPYWDFTKRMNQAKEKYSHQPAVVDGLNDTMLPYDAQPHGSSAMDVAADATQQNIITGALPSFVDLLNVVPPSSLLLFVFVIHVHVYGVYVALSLKCMIPLKKSNSRFTLAQSHLKLGSVSSMMWLCGQVM
jgi:hypothetical protein